jgi:hypothetical protein
MPRLFDRAGAEAAVRQLQPLVFELAGLMRRHRQEAPGEESLEAATRWQRSDPAMLAHTFRLARFYEVVAAITEAGAELKDPDTGLLDFRAMLHGREVNLCWRLGEERIGFYHELDEGFKQRRILQDEDS